MSYQDLSVAEMIQISSLWVAKPGKNQDGTEVPTLRPLLESNPLLSAMLPYLEKVHNDLLTFNTQPKAEPSKEVSEIEQEQKVLDIRHDDLCRFIFHFMDLLQVLVSEELRAVLAELRAKMFRDGLQVIKYNFSREAGAAKLIEGKLTEEDRLTLRSISVSFEGRVVSLYDLTHELIEKGKRLGDLENKKDEIIRGVTPSTIVTERSLTLAWVSRVITLERMIATAELSEEEEESLLGLLRRLERAASERSKRGDERASAAGGA